MSDISKIDGVAVADIASVDGTLAANIAKVDGLDWPSGGSGATHWRVEMDGNIRIYEMQFRSTQGGVDELGALAYTNGAVIYNYSRTNSWNVGSAWDNNISSYAWNPANPNPTWWFGQIFSPAIDIEEVYVQFEDSNTYVPDSFFRLQYSNDGTNWTTKYEWTSLQGNHTVVGSTYAFTLNGSNVGSLNP